MELLPLITLLAASVAGVCAVVAWRQARRLRSNERLLKAVIDAAPVAVWVKEPDGRLVFANRRFASWSGRTPEELVGKSTPVSTDDAISRELQVLHQRAIASDGPLNVELALPLADKPAHSVLVTTGRFAQNEGHPPTIIGAAIDITDHKRVEHQARQIAARLDEAQAVAGIGSWSQWPGVQHGDWSIAMRKLHAWPTDEPIPGFDHYIDHCLHPLDRERARAVVADFLATGEHVEQQFRVLRHDESMFWGAFRAQVERDANGAVVRYFGTVQDISERVAHATAVARADAISQAICDASGALMLLLDRQGCIERFNPACERLSGWSAAEVIGRPFWEVLIPPEHHQRQRTLFGQLVTGLFPNQVDNEWLLRGGRRVWISFSNTAILDHDGKVMHVVSIGIETTHRREAERLLIESEERQRTLIDLAPDAIVVIDAERQCLVSGNPNAAHLFGVERESLAGAPLMRFCPERQPDGRTSAEAFKGYCDLALHGQPVTCEWTHLNTHGQPFVCEVSLVRLPGDGAPQLRCSVVDITERKRAQATRLAAERGAVIGRLAGVMAHEVNNPLHVIKAYIEPLSRRASALPQVLKGLSIIDQQVDRIARQVGALQEFVRPGILRKHAVLIGQAVRVVIELFEPRFTKMGKHLATVIPDDLPAGVLDSAALQQVLVTLLENALDAVPTNGHVTLSAAVDGQTLVLEVSDDGPGLGDDPEHLFADFITTKPDGTGLGLPTARRLCRDHGGWLEARNGSTGGAVFTARLHLDEPPRAPRTSA